MIRVPLTVLRAHLRAVPAGVSLDCLLPVLKTLCVFRTPVSDLFHFRVFVCMQELPMNAYAPGGRQERSHVFGSFRTNLLKVAEHYRHHTEFLSSDKLLEGCATLCPSETGHFRCFFFSVQTSNLKHAREGFPGGQPFLDFLEMQGRQVSVQKFAEIQEGAARGTMTPVRQLDEFSGIVEKEKSSFLGFMLSALAKISNFSKARQYHCTSSALHHGLSRYGHHFQAHLGNMMKISNFDRERRIHLQKAEELARFFLGCLCACLCLLAASLCWFGFLGVPLLSELKLFH